MCDECRQINEDARTFIRDIDVWTQEQTDLPDEPDGVGQMAATSAGVVAKAIGDRILGTVVGEMVMETVRVAFFAGVRAARQEREAPNGEGELAPVQMVPIAQPQAKS